MVLLEGRRFNLVGSSICKKEEGLEKKYKCITSSKVSSITLVTFGLDSYLSVMFTRLCCKIRFYGTGLEKLETHGPNELHASNWQNLWASLLCYIHERVLVPWSDMGTKRVSYVSK